MNEIEEIEKILKELKEQSKQLSKELTFFTKNDNYNIESEEILKLGKTCNHCISLLIQNGIPKPLYIIILLYTPFYNYTLGLYKMNDINYFDQDYTNKYKILNSDKFDINLCFKYKDEFNELYDFVKGCAQWISGPCLLHEHNFNYNFDKTTKTLLEYNGEENDKSYMNKIAYLRTKNDVDSIRNYLSNEYSDVEYSAQNIFMGAIDGEHYDVAIEMIQKITHSWKKEICVQYVCLNAKTNVAIDMIYYVLIKNKHDIQIFCGKTIEWQKYIDCAKQANNNDLLKYIEICKKNDEKISQEELMESYFGNVSTKKSDIKENIKNAWNRFINKITTF
jgi:hypothetical protein